MVTVALLLVFGALLLVIRHPLIGVTVLSMGLIALGCRELLEPLKPRIHRHGH